MLARVMLLAIDGELSGKRLGLETCPRTRVFNESLRDRLSYRMGHAENGRKQHCNLDFQTRRLLL
jgi:hypothetical protein